MPKFTKSKSEMFVPGKYTQFRKGDLYRDPRIQQRVGEADFLILNGPEDIEFLAEYLGGKLDNYPSEDYNMFTTGIDKNGNPLIGMYWVNESMDNLKKAMICCFNGVEEAALEVVDQYCKASDDERSWEAQSKAQPAGRVVGTIGLGALSKYKN